MNKHLLSLLTLGASLTATGQDASPDVVAASGGYGQTASFSVSWTLGETLSGTFVGDDATISQGFQQNDLVITGLEDVTNKNITVFIYPNPVANELHFTLNKETNLSATATLFDEQGKALEVRSEIRSKEVQTIPFAAYSAGSYFLRIDTEEGPATFKIVKK